MPKAHLVSLLEAGEHSTAELTDLFGIDRRSTVPVSAAEQRKPDVDRNLSRSTNIPAGQPTVTRSDHALYP